MSRSPKFEQRQSPSGYKLPCQCRRCMRTYEGAEGGQCPNPDCRAYARPPFRMALTDLVTTYLGDGVSPQDINEALRDAAVNVENAL